MVSQIKVNEIIKQSGSSITIGETNDTITLPATATLTNFPDNTPRVIATGSSLTLSDNTWTKLTFSTEVVDTDSAFADSKFTVPSGKAGDYLCNFMAYTYGALGNTIGIRIYKNGGATNPQGGLDLGSNNLSTFSAGNSLVINLSASDYIEIYARMNVGSGSVTVSDCQFSIAKLLG
tara:strand:+ start:42 stop:572 length:531 start_codon:yes stop_codon:yes gene_type:complete